VIFVRVEDKKAHRSTPPANPSVQIPPSPASKTAMDLVTIVVSGRTFGLTISECLQIPLLKQKLIQRSTKAASETPSADGDIKADVTKTSTAAQNIQVRGDVTKAVHETQSAGVGIKADVTKPSTVRGDLTASSAPTTTSASYLNVDSPNVTTAKSPQEKPATQC
jgi:hypothetical protein